MLENRSVMVLDSIHAFFDAVSCSAALQFPLSSRSSPTSLLDLSRQRLDIGATVHCLTASLYLVIHTEQGFSWSQLCPLPRALFCSLEVRQRALRLSNSCLD